MEVLAGAFDESLRRDLYPIFEDVQERLGTLNDHATAQRMLNWWATIGASSDQADVMRGLADAEGDSMERARIEFQSWWTGGVDRSS